MESTDYVLKSTKSLSFLCLIDYSPIGSRLRAAELWKSVSTGSRCSTASHLLPGVLCHIVSKLLHAYLHNRSNKIRFKLNGNILPILGTYTITLEIKFSIFVADKLAN